MVTIGKLMDKFYTIKEVANILSVSPRTVRNMIKTGRIRGVDVSGIVSITYRILDKELDRFVAVNYEKLRKKHE